MKTMGVLGGMGPQASVRFYQLCVTLSRARHGAVTNSDYPHILLSSLPVPDFISDRASEAHAVRLVEKEIERLAGAGADFLVLACNTMHLHAERFKEASPVPFYALTDIVVEAVRNDQCRRVVVLGTPTTHQTGLYRRPLEAAGIAVREPDGAGQLRVEKLIRTVIQGRTTITDVEGLQEEIALWAADCDGVVLGCTELPLLLPKAVRGVPRMYDCLELLGREACRQAYRC